MKARSRLERNPLDNERERLTPFVGGYLTAVQRGRWADGFMTVDTALRLIEEAETKPLVATGLRVVDKDSQLGNFEHEGPDCRLCEREDSPYDGELGDDEYANLLKIRNALAGKTAQVELMWEALSCDCVDEPTWTQYARVTWNVGELVFTKKVSLETQA